MNKLNHCHDARDTGEDMVEKYEEKKAEGKEKMNELKCMAREKL